MAVYANCCKSILAPFASLATPLHDLMKIRCLQKPTISFFLPCVTFWHIL